MNYEQPDSLENEIQTLFDEDQSDRRKKIHEKDPERALQNDLRRLEEARKIYNLFRLEKIFLTTQSKYNLAMIFQHGENNDDFEIARNLAEEAYEENHPEAAWLSAAAEDRYLLSIGKKQIWGTQFTRNEEGEWELLPMEDSATSGITDEMRQERGVMGRKE